MNMFVDTNIFLRYLLDDDLAKTARCLDLFQRAAQGDVRLFTSESVVAEIVYVLSSPNLYRLPHSQIAYQLRPLIEIKGLTVDHKRSLLEAIDLYEETRLDFEDCLIVAHMRRNAIVGVVSYDRHFDRIPDVNRIEP